MKTLKCLMTAAGYFIAIYFAIFALWFLMMYGCVSERRNGCEDNSLTRLIQVTHAPLINFLIN